MANNMGAKGGIRTLIPPDGWAYTRPPMYKIAEGIPSLEIFPYTLHIKCPVMMMQPFSSPLGHAEDREV
jgi:hypothetical protein